MSINFRAKCLRFKTGLYAFASCHLSLCYSFMKVILVPPCTSELILSHKSPLPPIIINTYHSGLVECASWVKHLRNGFLHHSEAGGGQEGQTDNNSHD
jgi:hypothetical protein